MAQSPAAVSNRDGHAEKPTEGGGDLTGQRFHSLSAVIPARNKAPFIARCVGSVLDAANRSDVEVIIVENGSADDTWGELQRVTAGKATLIRSPVPTAGAARNLGAQRATGQVLCFLDADVEIPEDYFERVQSVLTTAGPAAAGCTVQLPEDGWISRTWGRLHDRGVNYLATLINGANFCVRREAFQKVGGFDVGLVTGEDADICLRLTDAGYTLVESTRLRVLHLDNPVTIRDFARKEIWHGLGAGHTFQIRRLDRPLVMTLVHGVLLTVSVIALASRRFDLIGWSMAAAAAFAVPLATVQYRLTLARAPAPLLQSLVLYQVYFLARLGALILSLARQGRSEVNP